MYVAWSYADRHGNWTFDADTLMRWSEIKEVITVLVDQLSWMLDGWDRHIDRWRDAAWWQDNCHRYEGHKDFRGHCERRGPGVGRDCPPGQAKKGRC